MTKGEHDCTCNSVKRIWKKDTTEGPFHTSARHIVHQSLLHFCVEFFLILAAVGVCLEKIFGRFEAFFHKDINLFLIDAVVD